jgi:cytidylate kinase
LLVVTGPPGAGKSTVAAALVGRLDPSALVEGDAFFAFLRSGAIEPWRRESREQNTTVTAASGAAAGRFVAGGLHTVFDGIVGPWFLDEFLAATGLDSLDYVILLPTLDCCVHRVATRANHGFADEAATRHMHDQFARSEIDERHVLRSTGEDVAAVAGLIVAARHDGRLTYAPATSGGR